MATYDSIAKNWFFVRYLRTLGSFDAFEAQAAIEDRLESRRVMARMLQEAPVTAQSLFAITLTLDLESLKALDTRITAGEAEWWMKHSDPDDPNNYFKLTLSEFAVHLGTICVGALGAAWQYARMPNYFQSVVVAEGFEFRVFDALMKKCSHDFGHESLHDKFFAYAHMVERRRQLGIEEPQ